MTKITNAIRNMQKARWFILPVLFVCLILIVSMSSISYAKYYKEFLGNNTANVSVMASDVVLDFSFADINLKPGSEVTIPINLVNKKNGFISQVRQIYTMEVSTLSNIPLQVTILNGRGEAVTPSGTFEAGVLGMHEYQIKIVWNAGDNDYNLSYELEVVRIFINSTQIGGE